MTLDFALFNYFPYGGLQRDFLKTAIKCQQLGYSINVYTSSWQGDIPDGFSIQVLPITGSSNHRRMESFQEQLVKATKQKKELLLIGFNKLAGLDVYFASDTCYREKAMTERNFLYRLTPRYKAYERMEKSVFTTNNHSLILTLTEQQKTDFQKNYQTQESRFLLLPPGIERNSFITEHSHVRTHYRRQLNIPENSHLLLLIGSSFKTKGLDRAINALGCLPKPLLKNICLLVVGGDNPKPFIRQAAKLNIASNIIFCGVRDDIQKLMLCADTLIHPAHTESAGMVLIEALVAGLAVLTTANCGYAFHIETANTGIVSPCPFNQQQLNQDLLEVIVSKHRNQWNNNAIAYANSTDLYSLHQQAAEAINALAKR